MAEPAALLSQQMQFDEYARLRRYSISCYHFSSIFLWKDFFEFDFRIINGNLCVLAKHALGNFLYLPPLGTGLNPAIIEQCFAMLNKENRKKSLSRIENVMPEDLKYFDPQKYRIVEKSKEYCYTRQDIAELRGNKYKSKRASFNQFTKNNAHDYIPFEREWIKDCQKLFDNWADNRKSLSQDSVYLAMLEENKKVHDVIFHYYDELGLEGRLVLVDERPQAYTFGYPLNDDTFCVLVEITNLNIKGLSAYTFSRFCGDKKVAAYKFINAMDDFAMDNIAKVKDSFHPASLYPSYVVMERE